MSGRFDTLRQVLTFSRGSMIPMYPLPPTSLLDFQGSSFVLSGSTSWCTGCHVLQTNAVMCCPLIAIWSADLGMGKRSTKLVGGWGGGLGGGGEKKGVRLVSMGNVYV